MKNIKKYIKTCVFWCFFVQKITDYRAKGVRVDTVTVGVSTTAEEVVARLEKNCPVRPAAAATE